MAESPQFPQQSSDPDPSAAPSGDEVAERVHHALETGSIAATRLDFFAALHNLQTGDTGEAILGFRRAARACEAPFDALSTVALGELERVAGREAAAIRAWERVARSPAADATLREVAWLSLAAVAETRKDTRLARAAAAGLEELSKINDTKPCGEPADE